VDNRLLDVDQAAELLGLHAGTLYRWARAGRVPCIRMGQRVLRFDPRSLEKYLRQNTREPRRT
jgi:excisionase family DNA binding protein